MLVDLMIVGAQKCATTTLFSTLEGHPQLRGPRIKETNFFSFDPVWKDHLHKYHGGFDQTPGKLYFEASPTYTFPTVQDLPHATTSKAAVDPMRQGSFRPIPNVAIWEDIFRYNPAMKVIYLVRNPLERIVTGYMHYYARGYTDLGLEDELAVNDLHLEVSCYASRIQPFIDRFGREQVLIIKFDDLLLQRRTVLERIATFIGIDPTPFYQLAPVHENATIGHGKLPVKWDAPNLFWTSFRKLAPTLWRRYAARDERRFEERPVLSSATKQRLLHRLEGEISHMALLMNDDLAGWRN